VEGGGGHFFFEYVKTGFWEINLFPGIFVRLGSEFGRDPPQIGAFTRLQVYRRVYLWLRYQLLFPLLFFDLNQPILFISFLLLIPFLLLAILLLLFGEKLVLIVNPVIVLVVGVVYIWVLVFVLLFFILFIVIIILFVVVVMVFFIILFFVLILFFIFLLFLLFFFLFLIIVIPLCLLVLEIFDVVRVLATAPAF
jgi:20S proteasome subunit beta 7